MNHAELEAWARDVIGRVVSGALVEDVRIECKAEFPSDHARAARQIGGLANAARAPEVLLLVGIDEARHVATGADLQDLATWWPQVKKRFDGVAPRLVIDHRVPVAGGLVLALLFDARAVPFVLRPRDGNDDRLEVPWREGTGTRSARHGDLIDILVPLVARPTLEVLEGWVEVRKGKDAWLWVLHLAAYLEVVAPCVFPDHRTAASVRCRSWRSDWALSFETSMLRAPNAGSGIAPFMSGVTPVSNRETIHQATQQLVADGPGRVVVEARSVQTLERLDLSRVEELEARFECRAVGQDWPQLVEVRLDREFLDPRPTSDVGMGEPFARWLVRMQRPM